MSRCCDPEKSCPKEKLLSLYPLTLDQVIQALLKAKRAERARKTRSGLKTIQSLKGTPPLEQHLTTLMNQSVIEMGL